MRTSRVGAAGAAEAANDAVFQALTNVMLEQQRRHPGVPIDERQLMRGLRRNDETSNIANWSVQARAEDAAYYNGLPMYMDSTDPANTAADEASQDEVDARLRASLQQIRAENAAVRRPAVATAATSSATAPTLTCAHPRDSEEACNPLARASQEVCNPLARSVSERGFVAAWSGVMRDLDRWDALPEPNITGRLTHVFAHGERAAWVAGTLLAVAGVAAAARIIAARV